jgi:hypothetical protein
MNRSNKDGLQHYCKPCCKAVSTEWRNKNRERYLESIREWILKNKKKHKKSKSKWITENKEYHAHTKRQWINNRRKKDKLFHLSSKVRTLIHNSFRKRGYSNVSRTYKILGCSFEELKLHLEKTWTARYGSEYLGQKVHIDHIIPLNSAKSEEDIIKLNHYTNLQYLTPKDNLKKSSKYVIS